MGINRSSALEVRRPGVVGGSLVLGVFELSRAHIFILPARAYRVRHGSALKGGELAALQMVVDVPKGDVAEFWAAKVEREVVPVP